ncbi:hypothetical protein DIZ76_015245 [Coccidioides immitis]|nr:hypothetical protein DIZ76_015245 [Coccidioides immitis]
MDPSQRPRKRARMACIWCHERKVRCDVSIHGNPCTNCRLDGHECAIRASSGRGRGVKIPPRADTALPNALVHKPNSNAGLQTAQKIIQIPDISRFADPARQNQFGPNLWEAREIPFETFATLEAQIPKFILPTAIDAPRHNSNVVFSFYRFLELSDLPTLPAEDVRYLELKGSLHVPASPILDEFVRQYFLHVHPCLPVIHEGDFWRSYYNRPGHSRKPHTISLFVFQAMLFASCAFVPFQVINAAGFPDTRTARNILYDRAKLLYNLNAEHNVLYKAQGSVLLTYQSSSVNRHAGSLWLTSAIQNALLLEAHNYHKLNHDDPLRNTKKRLWWSILLRDRILPLGLRRHLQIASPNFDLSLDCMDERDMQEEMYCSEVYNVETKRHLAKVLNLQCQLAMVLTDVVATVYAANGFTQPPPMTETELEASVADVVGFRENLAHWARDAKAAFAPFHGPKKPHESVILYSELTNMYYHAARVALCHYEALLLEANSDLVLDSYENRLQALRDDLESSALGITKSVKRLLAHGVACHLPISAIAYTALPLVLNALDVKLSGSGSQSATRKRRLRYYAEVMQLYRSRYDGTDDVAVYIREILHFAEAQNLSILEKPLEGDDPNVSQETRGWAEVFIRQPRFYLRLSLTLDYALARGRYPQDSDLPILVRELPVKAITHSTYPDKTLSQEIAAHTPKADPGEQKQNNDQPLSSTDSTSPKINTDDSAVTDTLTKAEMPSTQATSPPWSPEQFGSTNEAQEKHESSPIQPHDSQQPSSPPHYQDVQDINIDFLDLGCMQSMEDMNFPDEIDTSTDIDWANTMLDEILNAIPA